MVFIKNKNLKLIILFSILFIGGALMTSCDKSYSYNHNDPNEANYRTVLADLSKIKNGEKSFALREEIADFSKYISFDQTTEKIDGWGYDMRSCDVSGLDLSYIEDYNDVTFNSQTKFPDDSKKLPKDFDPEYILEFNKNPGLGIRELHNQGITGKGVGIAIIDQPLLLEHEQYSDNLMSYERIHCSGDAAAMHGPAVASIAVGKDIGVAPAAKLYYIANTFGHWNQENNSFDLDFTILADCILRVLEINKNLPEDEKIRVISISRGYNSRDNGYKELQEAIDKANGENIFVITTSTEEYYKKFKLFGADRDYYANPDDFTSYEPANWVRESVLSGNNIWVKDSILFPMGSRTYAGCTGTENYDIVHDGGLSWSVPWCAGFYALCCQVKPDITPEEFIEIITATSVPAEIVRNLTGEIYNFGSIVNPDGVIKELQVRIK